jgi:hypothetical protein
MRGHRFTFAFFLSASALLSISQPSLAKHRPGPPSVDSDPCAAPNAYVREHINQIKALQASAPKSNGNLLDMLGGRNEVDNKRSAEISQLRYDADGVNALLVAGGCQSYDLDRELSQTVK